MPIFETPECCLKLSKISLYKKEAFSKTNFRIKLDQLNYKINVGDGQKIFNTYTGIDMLGL